MIKIQIQLNMFIKLYNTNKIRIKKTNRLCIQLNYIEVYRRVNKIKKKNNIKKFLTSIMERQLILDKKIIKKWKNRKLINNKRITNTNMINQWMKYNKKKNILINKKKKKKIQVPQKKRIEVSQQKKIKIKRSIVKAIKKKRVIKKKKEKRKIIKVQEEQSQKINESDRIPGQDQIKKKI